MMTNQSHDYVSEMNEEAAAMVRRYLGWVRNINDAGAKRTVIDRLARYVHGRMDDRFKSDRPNALVTKPKHGDYSQYPDNILAWRLVGNVYLLADDGKVYDIDDPRMRLGLRVNQQDAVLDALVRRLPGQAELVEFIESEIEAEHWIDKHN